jgi:biotin operon repressor
MNLDQILATVFELLRNDELSNDDLCDFLGATPGQVDDYIETIIKSGIEVDAIPDNGDTYYCLRTEEVMYKRFLRFEDFLTLRSVATDARPLTTKKGLLNFANNLQYEQNRVPDINDGGLMYFPDIEEVSDQIVTTYLAIKNSTVINFDYVDANLDNTLRNIEPLELFYRDDSWYVWAYCHLRHALRMFKLSEMDSMVSTKQSFIRRPFNILEGTNDTRPFTERYFVTLEFSRSFEESIRKEFRHDKLVILPDRILVLEKDLYNRDYAQKFLAKYGSKVNVTYPD